MPRLMTRTAFFLTLTAASYAQVVVAPQLGLIADGTSLRPVAGIPASAVVGAPISVSRNLSKTVVAASQAFALALDADTGEVLLVTAAGAASPIPKTAANPDRIQLSPAGSSALLWYATVRQALIVKGLPDNPSVYDIDLSFAAADSTPMVVSDDGLTIAGSFAGTLYKFSSTGVGALPLTSPVLALAFAAGSTDLAVVSTTGASLWNASGVTLVGTFPSALNPTGAALDTRRMIVADSAGAIVTIDLASKSLSTLDCRCAPSGLFPLSRSYRLTALASGSFKLFDTDQNTVWFAPVALPAVSTGGAQ